jgi:uncharacterized membrane protein YwzB
LVPYFREEQGNWGDSALELRSFCTISHVSILSYTMWSITETTECALYRKRTNLAVQLCFIRICMFDLEGIRLKMMVQVNHAMQLSLLPQK